MIILLKWKKYQLGNENVKFMWKQFNGIKWEWISCCCGFALYNIAKYLIDVSSSQNSILNY